MKHAGVPAERHPCATRRHAFGLRRASELITRRPDLVERWLRTIGIGPMTEARPERWSIAPCFFLAQVEDQASVRRTTRLCFGQSLL